jgi:predicted transcriptional regulator/GNAT superfamily N-acetyltransferase
MLRIRGYKSEDRDQVVKLVLELKKFYPTIENWISRQIPKIEEGKVDCRVVEYSGKIGGVAISERKNPFKVKLKTFYLSEEFRGSGIGAYLLQDVVDRWAEERVRRIYVTFAEEEVEELLPFFHEYGFLFDGVSPFDQRDNVSEYIMSKILVYEEINEEKFADFVLNYLFRLRGYKVLDKGEDFFILQKLITVKESYKIYVKIITDTDPDEDIVERVRKEGDELNCVSKIIVTYYPLPVRAKNEDVKVIDGFDIETMFYPLVLRRKKYVGLISSIKKKFADRILYDSSQTLLSADKKSLRVDNVFYKHPITFTEIKRGSTFVFYESAPIKAVVGEGKIKEVVLDTPENLFERFGSKGVYDLKDIKTCADRSNRVLAFVFGRTIKYKRQIPLDEIRQIKPNYDPQGSSFLSQEELDKFREAGGVRLK